MYIVKQITPKHQAKQQKIANLALIEKQNIVPFTCCLVVTDMLLKINTKLNIINLR
jgi:hypothetical protein